MPRGEDLVGILLTNYDRSASEPAAEIRDDFWAQAHAAHRRLKSAAGF
jgi:hypothetical protein